MLPKYLVPHPRNYCQIQFMKLCCMLFSLKVFIILAFIFRSLIHFEIFFFLYGVRAQLHSSACGYSVLAIPFVEKTPFPFSGLGILILSEIVWPYSQRFIWGSLFYSMVYISVFMPVQHCSNYRSFVISFEWNQEVWDLWLWSSFSRLFKIVLAI